MIGFFPPLVNRILDTGARLTVAELNPKLVCNDGRYRVSGRRSSHRLTCSRATCRSEPTSSHSLSPST